MDFLLEVFIVLVFLFFKFFCKVDFKFVVKLVLVFVVVWLVE